MEHALVIGGTGMLAKVAIYLAEKDYHVSVVGRNYEKSGLYGGGGVTAWWRWRWRWRWRCDCMVEVEVEV